MKPPILLLLLLFFISTEAQKATVKKASPFSSSQSSAPILSRPELRKGLNENMNTVNFIPNKGQYSKEVLYSFSTPQAQMIIFKDKIRLVNAKTTLQKIEFKNKQSFPAVTDKQYVDIFFTGANKLNPTAQFDREAASYNYFSSEKNVTNVKAAAELFFPEIYKGVTLRLYSNKSGSLEFDWLVSKADDYSQIRMQFLGQNFLKVDTKGNLEIGLRFGSLKLKIPETYQLDAKGKRLSLQGRFVFSSINETKYFIKGIANPKLPLVIDPVLQWGAYMDGDNANFDAYLFGGVADSNGDIYVAGASQRITTTDIQSAAYGSPIAGFLSTPPSGAGTGSSGASGDGVDWLIMKIKKDGSRVLTYTFFGLSSTVTTKEQAHCIAISPNGGSVFVGGICTTSSVLNLPGLSSGYTGNTAFGGTSTSAASVPTIAVFTSDLASLKYRTFVGSGFRQGDVCSIEALNDNDYIVASYVNGSLGSGTGSVAYASGPDNTYSSSNDIYIAKFTNFNTRAWGTYVGGDGDDKVFDMRLLSNNDVAFCGYATSTNSSISTLSNEVASTANRGNSTTARDALVGVIKSDGTAFNMLSKVGGNGNDEFDGLQPGPCDTLYLTGTTSSTNFPNIGTGVLQTTNAGGTADMIIFKCPAAGGNTGVGTYYGGSALDIGNSVAYIPVGSGRLFIFGTTQSTSSAIAVNNIAGNTFYNNTNSGSYDMFFLECSTDFKTLYFATYVGGSDMDYLGDTGSQITGKQMVMTSDSSIGIFTTTHSTSLTPNIISPSGVFDNTKSNTSNDAWTIFVLNTKDSYGNIDAGDAPVSYGKATVEIAKSGTNSLVSLGNKVDEDSYYPASPGTNALYDDNEGNSTARKAGTSIFYNPGASGSSTVTDEDALTAGAIASVDVIQPTYTVTIPYYNNSGTTCTVYGLIDFNIDGDFDDANEKVSVTSLASNSNAAGTAGRTVTLTWTLPSGVLMGNSYLRLIIVEGAGAGSLSGTCSSNMRSAQNQGLGIGEVEDYPIVITSTLLSKALKFSVERNLNFNTSYWQMTTGADVAYFEVERSRDGLGYNKIGTISPQNQPAEWRYSFNDNNRLAQTEDQYYRLKVVGKNGSVYYSEIVRLSALINKLAVHTLSNPFKQQLQLMVSTVNADYYTLSLVDLAGKTIWMQKQLLQKGNNPLIITETSKLLPGAYLLRVNDNTESITLKLLKE